MTSNYNQAQLEALRRQAEQLNQKAEEARKNAEQISREATEKTQTAMQTHQEAKFSDSPEAARQAEIARQEANAAQAQAKEAQQALKDAKQQAMEAEQKLKNFEEKAKESEAKSEGKLEQNSVNNENKSEGKLEQNSANNEVQKNEWSGDAMFDKNWQQHWQNHSDPEVRKRFETAHTFYKDAYKDAGYSDNEIFQEMKGINFNREVTVEPIKPGEVFKQYQYPEANREGKMGSYFSKDSDKSELGIQGDSLSNQNRVPELYVANQEFKALKSTSSDVENWGKNKELNYGGGTQYFVAEKDKGSLSRWERAENKTDTYNNMDQYLGVQKQANTESQTQTTTETKTDTYSQSNRG